MNVCCELINPYKYFTSKEECQNFIMYKTIHLDKMLLKNTLCTEWLSVYMSSKVL